MISRSLSCLLLATLALLMGACAHRGPTRGAFNPLSDWVPSANHDQRGVQLIVVHSTQQSSARASLDTLRSRNPGGRVSAHYLVGRNGHVYQLVHEGRRAWHAGGGSWGTIHDLNSASIGIELDNDGSSAYPDEQIDALIVLLEDLCRRLEIPRAFVIGHADLAPWRKTDPGPRFPWQRLAEAGFGRWPDPQAAKAARPSNFNGWVALQLLGYSMRDPQAALRAFRLHYRGVDDTTSPMDAQDEALLYGLTAESWRVAPAGE